MLYTKSKHSFSVVDQVFSGADKLLLQSIEKLIFVPMLLKSHILFDSHMHLRPECTALRVAVELK